MLKGQINVCWLISDPWKSREWVTCTHLVVENLAAAPDRGQPLFLADRPCAFPTFPSKEWIVLSASLSPVRYLHLKTTAPLESEESPRLFTHIIFLFCSFLSFFFLPSSQPLLLFALTLLRLVPPCSPFLSSPSSFPIHAFREHLDWRGRIYFFLTLF